MSNVWIVTKNRDFTEGRGPMLFHSVWANFEDAKAYVEDQPGIYGSKQEKNVGGVIDQNGFTEYNYNGFYITETNLRDNYRSEKVAEARERVESLEKELRDARKALWNLE